GVGDQAGDVSETLERVDQQLAFVLLDRVDADVADVVDSGSEADRLRDRLCPRLELERDLTPGCLLQLDLADHVAAEVEGSHRLEQLPASPERADARRAAHLVRGEGEEVAVELLDVDRMMRCGLRGVDDHDRSLLVRPGGKALDGIDRSEGVRDEVVADDLDVARERDLLERIELQLAVLVEGNR